MRVLGCWVGLALGCEFDPESSLLLWCRVPAFLIYDESE
jgi:hypothetical protein